MSLVRGPVQPCKILAVWFMKATPLTFPHFFRQGGILVPNHSQAGTAGGASPAAVIRQRPEALEKSRTGVSSQRLGLWGRLFERGITYSNF